MKFFVLRTKEEIEFIHSVGETLAVPDKLDGEKERERMGWEWWKWKGDQSTDSKTLMVCKYVRDRECGRWNRFTWICLKATRKRLSDVVSGFEWILKARKNIVRSVFIGCIQKGAPRFDAVVNENVIYEERHKEVTRSDLQVVQDVTDIALLRHTSPAYNVKNVFWKRW